MEDGEARPKRLPRRDSSAKNAKQDTLRPAAAYSPSRLDLSCPIKSFGSKELAKRSVLLTRLSATEDAATVDVLCVGSKDTPEPD
jgi:hypothetical protein